MLTEAAALPASSTLSGDVVIIGAGAAGIPAAVELSRAGINVILIESGGLRADRRLTTLSRGEVLNAQHAPLERYRVRALGGTTSVWGGRCAPLDEIDFTNRHYVRGSGWPIGLDDLRPFYERAHDYLHLGAYDYSADSLSTPSTIRTTSLHSDTIWRFSDPVDLGKKWRAYLRDAPNVNLLLGATATELVTDASGGLVTACVVRTLGGAEAHVQANEFVLAGGGLEVTRLLLASRSAAHPGGIGDHSGMLGRHYSSHLAGHLGPFRWQGEQKPVGATYERDTDGVYCRRTISLAPEAQRRHELLNFRTSVSPPPLSDPSHRSGVLSAAFLAKRFVLGKIPPEYDAEFGHAQSKGVHRQHVLNVLTRLPELLRFAPWWLVRRILPKRKIPSMEPPSSDRFYLHFDAEQSPSEESRVRLSDEVDPLGMARLTVKWAFNPSDVSSILTSYRILADELESAGIAVCEEDMDEAARRIPVQFGVGSHHIGTTRMSVAPVDGVVDAQCRVHGVANLSIASASVFPTSGVANPTLTITAIALRIAQRLVSHARSTPVSELPGAQP